MFATWPMVFGALLAGLVIGVLVPERPTDPGRKYANDGKSFAATSPSANGSAKTTTPSVEPAPDAAAPAERSCDEQVWPHLSPACIAGAKQASQPVRVIPTRRSNPEIAVKAAEPSGGAEDSAPSDRPAPHTSDATPPMPVPSPVPTRASADEKPEPDQQEKAERKPAPQPDAAATARPQRAATQPPSRQRTARNRTYTARTPDLADDFEDERPRVFIQRDGTRIYVVPQGRYSRRLEGVPRRDW